MDKHQKKAIWIRDVSLATFALMQIANLFSSISFAKSHGAIAGVIMFLVILAICYVILTYIGASISTYTGEDQRRDERSSTQRRNQNRDE